jgi:hypothetical protein
MFRSNIVVLVSVLAVALAATFAVTASGTHRGGGQGGQVHRISSIGCRPFLRAWNDSAAIVVTGVRSELKNGTFLVTQLEIENHTDRPVTAVGLELFVTRPDDADNILKNVESPNFTLSEVLQPGEAEWLVTPQLAFFRVLATLEEDESLIGDFAAHFAVSEVRFSDGLEERILELRGGVATVLASYDANASQAASRVPALSAASPSASPSIPPIPSPPPCPDDSCAFDPTTVSWACIPVTGLTCTNNLATAMCTTTACPGGNKLRPPAQPIFEPSTDQPKAHSK